MSKSKSDKIIEKIKKCLALSSSDNEHEAAAALRQARHLMRKYNIDERDMLACDVGESKFFSRCTRRPPNYEAKLANDIANAFGCELLFKTGNEAHWKFIGCDAAPEIARYAYQVLVRQLKRFRDNYLKTVLKRCNRTTKTRRANLFCEGWVLAVTEKIIAFAGTDRQRAAIAAFIYNNYQIVLKNNKQDKNDKHKISDEDYIAILSGASSAKDVQLNHGIPANETLALN